MAQLTADLARFVSELRLESIPEQGRAIAKTGFIDCYGVMVAGAREAVVGLVDRTLAGEDTQDGASLIPSGRRRKVADAALVNGVAAHVLDYDDVSLDGHPSAVLVPAILAQAEASGASGAEMLTAYVAGYEVWAELFRREDGHLHDKGWHPTAVLGAVAAAAACAKLRRMDSAATATAIAAAGSMSAGLVSNFGTMTKSFQVGRAAQSGVIAAALAAAGFTASPDALEHRAGFLMALSPGGKPDRDSPAARLGFEWQILHHGLNVKRYPVCYATHRSIDGALDLAQKHDLKPADIDSIRVSTGDTQMLMLRNHRPQTGLEAKFSMHFAMASSIVARNVGLSELTDEFVLRPEVQELMGRVTCQTTSETMPDLSFAPADSVVIRTRSGKELESGPIERAKGSHQKPLSADELRTKFTDCMARELPDATTSRVFERFMALELLNTAADLVRPRGGAAS
jgi:2-methylcitrate dehydratase PrpD